MINQMEVISYHIDYTGQNHPKNFLSFLYSCTCRITSFSSSLYSKKSNSTCAMSLASFLISLHHTLRT